MTADPLHAEAKAAKANGVWRNTTPDDRTRYVASALNIIAATERVAGIPIQDIAGDTRSTTCAAEAGRRRVLRAALGIVGRLYRVAPAVTHEASGRTVCRRPITDGAIWGLSAEGWPRTRPVVVAIMEAVAEQPQPDADDIARVLEVLNSQVPVKPAMPDARRGPLFDMTKGRHQDDPLALSADTDAAGKYVLIRVAE